MKNKILFIFVHFSLWWLWVVLEFVYLQVYN